MSTQNKATDRIAKGITIALLVSALALAGCGQAAPANAPTAAPANTPTAVPAATPTATPANTPTAAPSPTTALSSDAAAGLSRVEPYLDKLGKLGAFTGAALLAQDGKIVLSKAWGMADREKAIPNTPQTIFRVGDFTMQFTAAAVLLLEQEGKLSMQDPICNYLDNCPEAWKAITIHHLLSCSSGIPEYFDTGRPGLSKIRQEGATPQQLVAAFRDQPLAFKPGAKHDWSRSNFVLAGLIIERVSGQPYGDFMKQHVFEPLGMTRSGYGDPPEGLALGYPNASTKTPVDFNVSALYASGGCYSTAEDLFRWNEGLYNGKLLNEAQLQKMLTPHFTMDNGWGAGYGIVLYEMAGRKPAGYAGSPDAFGYSAVVDRYLDEHVTSLLICNQEESVTTAADEMEKAFFGAK
jgi:CubicO group peptidase (beta-lactamase class C family)